MRAYTGNSLPNCCGIADVGQFSSNADSWAGDGFLKIKDIPSRGCGIFVATFLTTQGHAMRECERYHTLLFKTGPHKNKGFYASDEGLDKGVYLCVYKYGKDTVK